MRISVCRYAPIVEVQVIHAFVPTDDRFLLVQVSCVGHKHVHPAVDLIQVVTHRNDIVDVIPSIKVRDPAIVHQCVIREIPVNEDGRTNNGRILFEESRNGG